MKLYTASELGNMMGIRRVYACSLLARGIIRGRKVGRHWVVHEDAIREFLMESGGRVPPEGTHRKPTE